MRVLVTGVTGQIGGALALRLAGRVAVIAANRQTLDIADPVQIGKSLMQSTRT
jgi:dTDP-4-dehydrorhamnose reductase